MNDEHKQIDASAFVNRLGADRNRLEKELAMLVNDRDRLRAELAAAREKIREMDALFTDNEAKLRFERDEARTQLATAREALKDVLPIIDDAAADAGFEEEKSGSGRWAEVQSLFKAQAQSIRDLIAAIQSKEGTRLEAENARLRTSQETLGKQIDALLDHCGDAECSVCAKIICPHEDEMHFHHDGCPSCCAVEDDFSQPPAEEEPKP